MRPLSEGRARRRIVAAATLLVFAGGDVAAGVVRPSPLPPARTPVPMAGDAGPASDGSPARPLLLANPCQLRANPCAIRQPARPPEAPGKAIRERIDETLKERLRGDEPAAPVAPLERPVDPGDDTIRRLGEKLRRQQLPPPAAPVEAGRRPADDEGCDATAGGGPAAEEIGARLRDAREALAATYDEMAAAVLAGHPVLQHLDAARETYAQTLGERPPQVGAAGPPRLARLAGVRFASADPNPALGAAPADAEAQRRVGAWFARMEAAAAELLAAADQRRTLLDAFVAGPEEGVERLMDLARRHGRVPLHPLLGPHDVAAAERAWALLATRRDHLVASLPTVAGAPPSPALAALGEMLYRAIALPPGPLPRGFSPLALDHEQQALARRLTEGLAAAAPRLLAALDRAEREAGAARSVGERDAARAVGAQVLFVELVGPDALVEAQKAFAPTSRVVDVALTPQGLERRLALGRVADVVRVEPVPRVADPLRARWRDALAAARETIADAEIDLLRVRHASPVERLRLDRDALARQVEAAMDQAAQRAAAAPAEAAQRQAARALPAARALQERLATAVREAERAPQAAGAGDVLAHARPLLPGVAQEVRLAEQAAAALALLDPGVRAAVAAWKRLDGQHTAARGRLADDPRAREQEARLAAQARADFIGALQSLVLPSLPPPEDVTPDASAGLAPAGGGAPRSSAPDEDAPIPVAWSESPAPRVLAQAAPAVAPAVPAVPWDTVHQVLEGADQRWRGRADSIRANFNLLADPQRLDRDRKAHDAEVAWHLNQMLGPGSRLSLDEIRAQVAQHVQPPRTAYGAVYTREQLNDPVFLQQLARARLGGWGSVIDLRDTEQVMALMRQRVGQWGVVSRRADLNDPEVLLDLYRRRLGGWGWAHRFQSAAEYRRFVQSRLGGLGRAYACDDLARAGWSPQQVTQIFQQAEKYAKKPFETDAQYRERMRREHPGEFTVDAQGRFRRKTTAEQQAERRAAMLESGKYVEDPRTGNLVVRDTKAGRALVEEERRRTTTTVEIPLADGGSVRVNVADRQSLYDALADTLRARGLSRDAAGDWVDATGHIVLSGERYLALDQRYLDAKSKADPDFAARVTYRAPPALIPVPPPSAGQELAALERQLRDTIGYNARSLEVGDRRLDVEVKPGQSVSDAVAARLRAEGRRVELDDRGNLKDAGTGEVLVRRERLAGWDQEFDRKVADAVFGRGHEGFTRDVQWLAERGTPAQQARAQELLQQMNRQVGDLRKAIGRQAELRGQLDALGDRGRLRAAGRAQYDALAKELGAATDRRRQLETALLEQTRTANASAARVVDESLTYPEREAVRQRERAAQAATGVAELDRQLREETLGPTARGNLERRRAALVEELVRAERKAGAHVTELSRAGQGTERVAALAPPVDTAGLGVPDGTVLSRAEAVSGARSVVLRQEEGGPVAYAGDGQGGRLVDTAGRPVKLSPGERSQVEQRLRRETAEAEQRRKAVERGAVTALLTQERLATAAQRRHAELQKQIDNYSTTLDGIPDTAGNTERRARIERRRTELIAEQAVSSHVVSAYQRQYAALSEDGRQQYERRRAEVAAERARQEQQHLDAGYAVEYVNEQGETVRLQTARQAAYQAEQRRRQEERAEAERRALETRERAAARGAEATARREADEARRAQEEARRLEAANREAASREAARRAEEARLLERMQDTRTRRAAAEARLRDAERAADAPGGDTDERREAVARARRDVEQARQGESGARLAAMTLPADPAFGTTLKAQDARVRESADAVRAARAQSARARQAWREALAEQGEGKATAEDVARARASYAARLRKTTELEGALASAELAATRLAEEGSYALASRAVNRARLDELEQKERANRAAGRQFYEGISPEDRQETARRSSLADYHDRVAAATARAEELRRLTGRRAAGGTLSADETSALDRGLSVADTTLLAGDAERRARLAELSREKDPERVARGLADLAQWMGSGQGALAGRSPTSAEAEAEYRRGTWKPGMTVPRTPSEWDRLQIGAYDAELTRRRAEAERHLQTVVEPALAKSREVDRKLAEFDRQALQDQAERRQAVEQVRQERAAAAAHVERLAAAVERNPDDAAAKRRLAEAERHLALLRQTLNRDEIRAESIEARAFQLESLRTRLAEQEQRVRTAQREVDRGGSKAALKSEQESRQRLAEQVRLYETLPHPDLDRSRARAAIEAERVPEHRYDHAVEALETAWRTQQAMEATRQRMQLEQEVAATRAAGAAQVEAARRAGGGQRLQDAEAGLHANLRVRERFLAEAERVERAEFERNRQQGIGPAHAYGVEQAARTAGIDWDRETRAHADRLEVIARGTERTIAAYQRGQMTAPAPSLVEGTLKELAERPLDPALALRGWKQAAAAAPYVVVGAAKGAGKVVEDTVKVAAGVVKLAGRHVIALGDKDTGDRLAEDYVKTWNVVGRLATDPSVSAAIAKGLVDEVTRKWSNLASPHDVNKRGEFVGEIIGAVVVGAALDPAYPLVSAQRLASPFTAAAGKLDDLGRLALSRAPTAIGVPAGAAGKVDDAAALADDVLRALLRDALESARRGGYIVRPQPALPSMTGVPVAPADDLARATARLRGAAGPRVLGAAPEASGAAVASRAPASTPPAVPGPRRPDVDIPPAAARAQPTIEPPRVAAPAVPAVPGLRRPDVDIPPAAARAQPTIEPPRVAAPAVPAVPGPRRPDVDIPPAPPPTVSPPVRVPGPGQPGAPDAPTVRMPGPGQPGAPDAPTIRVPGPEAPTVRTSPPGVGREARASGTPPTVGDRVPAAPPPAARAPGPADAPSAMPRTPESRAASIPQEAAVPRGPPTGAPGSSAGPLAGAEIGARASALEGHAVRLPRTTDGVDLGTVVIGKQVGGGHFGHLYGMEGRPGLLKVPTNNSGAAEAMARQGRGYDLIKDKPEIPTVQILARGSGGPGEPPFLVVENLFAGEWAKKGAYLKKSGEGLARDEVGAVKELYDSLVRRGLVWLDGHKANVFFFREGVRVRAGVLDHDMIMKADDIAKIGRGELPTAEFLQDKLIQGFLGHPEIRYALDGLGGKPFDHKGWMEGRFHRWYRQ